MASPEILESNFGNYSVRGIEEIIFPPAVSWLPATPAWKLLGIVILCVFVVALFRAVKKWRSNKYRRKAISTIADMRSTLNSDKSRPWQALCELPELMKTTALHAYPREDIASLSGRPWLEFLSSRSRNLSFSHGESDALTRLAYQAEAAATLSQSDATKLLDKCERWIRQHETLSGANTGD